MYARWRVGWIRMVWLVAAGVSCSRSGLEIYGTPEQRAPIELSCPLDADDPWLPEVAPGEQVELDGSLLAAGPVQSYRWSVIDEDCDAITPAPTYTLSAANQPVAKFTPGRPTGYHLRLEASGAFGQKASCDFVVPVTGQGVRIELCWATSTSTDLDLFVHTPRNRDPFMMRPFTDTYAQYTDSTCNVLNCGAALREGKARVDFGYLDSPLERCAGGPSPDDFRALGRCPNPRSGVDDNQQLASGTTEVVQIDQPREGDTFRVLVHNFDNEPASPHLFVYCDGQRVAALDPPATPRDFVTPSPGDFGVMWRPADVVAHASGGSISCTVAPLMNASGTGPDVTIDDPSY
jgi:hypothetical protein